MKEFEMTKDWCLAMSEQEGTKEISAGWIARDPRGSSAPVGYIGGRIAFGRFINLMRRNKQYTVEQLATEANIEVAELLSIEEDVYFRPDLRTVYCLAFTFGLSQQTLMELAGLATAQDSRVGEAAMRFAARSESLATLTKEERSALDAFLVDLADKTSGR